MLLDLWEWFLLINDGIELVFSNLASGTYPIPLSFILVFILFGLLSFFAWRSTDIPDLPPAPRPPYVIQITAGPGSGGARQTINDVRLLSAGAFFDGSEILSRYHNISRNQATNTDANNEQASTSSTSGTGANRNATPGARNSLGDTAGQTLRRRIPGRSLLLGLFRRPNQITRPVPAVSNAIRAQLSSPNLVVYHRVNVYHHHIHSHLGQNSGGTPRPPYQSQSNPVLSSSSPSSSFSVPQSTPSTSTPNPNQSSSFHPTSSILSENSEVNEGHRSTQEEQSLSAQGSGGGGDSVVGNVDRINSEIDETGSTNSAVHNQSGISEDSANSRHDEDSSHLSNMPARSGGGNGQSGGGDDCSHANYSQNGSNPENERIPGEDDIHFTIKFLNDTQLDVTSQLSEKIVDFKRRHFATEMAENKTVRLIFNGRVLDNDNTTLREFGIFDQCVVHCLIVNRQQHMDPTRGTGGLPTGRSNAGGQAGGVPGNVRRVVGLPEPGMFFVAFIGIFLIFLWFICLHFGQHLFTQSAVVSLTVLTAIFLIGIVACYLPLPAN